MTRNELKQLSAPELLDRVRAGYEFGVMHELLRRLQDPARAPGILKVATRTMDAGLFAQRLGELRDAAVQGDLRAAVLIVRAVHPVQGLNFRHLLHAVVRSNDLATITENLRRRTQRTNAQ